MAATTVESTAEWMVDHSDDEWVDLMVVRLVDEKEPKTAVPMDHMSVDSSGESTVATMAEWSVDLTVDYSADE